MVHNAVSSLRGKSGLKFLPRPIAHDLISLFPAREEWVEMIW